MNVYKIINTIIISDLDFDFIGHNFHYNKNEMPQIKISAMQRSSIQDPIEVYDVKFNVEKIMIYDCNIILSNKHLDSIIAYILNRESFHVLLLRFFSIYCIQKHRILQFHSSIIETSGCGIMFLGPSGIGKTTQAELWQKYRSSLIINGDIVFVQETESGFLGWGTPWHGSSPYCENTSVPLKAMVVLKQAEQNSIRELTGFEKVTEVSNCVFYPRWLEDGMELCLQTLDHLLTSIQVYELRCRPDEDAVRLTEQTVFGTY